MVITAQLDTRQTFARPERPLPRRNVLSPWQHDATAVLVDPGLAERPDFHDGWGAIRERHVPLVDDEQRDCSAILVTDRDKHRLDQLLRATYWRDAKPDEIAALQDGLTRATVVDADRVPADVVTMNSRVICQDASSGARSELQLVYPWEAQARKACISVLSPLGARMLGLSVGQPIELPEDASWRPSLRLAAVRYQPEREGHFHL